MRHKVINEAMIAQMGELKREGASYRQIADQFAVGLATVHNAFNGRKPPRPVNDNHPDRVTVYAAHNGGCSTTSGMMPVTLPRLRCLAAANDNGPTQQQVAA